VEAKVAARRTREYLGTTLLATVFLLPLAILMTLLLRPQDSTRPAARHTLPSGSRRSGDVGADGSLPLFPPLPDVLTGAGPPVPAQPGPLGIPIPMLRAYEDAAQRLRGLAPRCGLPWPILAAIGHIESNHADGGRVDQKGVTVRAILGPRLTGGPGAAAVPDTDGGRLDGDPVWDRALGPMQILPSTWMRFAVDGDDDGVASPHDVHDAILTAGNFLCAGGRDLRDPRALAAALSSYNHSASYVRAVLLWADAYARAVLPPPPAPNVLAGQRVDAPSTALTSPPPPSPPPPSPPPPAPVPGGFVLASPGTPLVPVPRPADSPHTPVTRPMPVVNTSPSPTSPSVPSTPASTVGTVPPDDPDDPPDSSCEFDQDVLRCVLPIRTCSE
jgi:hypothetical protein